MNNENNNNEIIYNEISKDLIENMEYFTGEDEI
jgi:hypothetical protein